MLNIMIKFCFNKMYISVSNIDKNFSISFANWEQDDQPYLAIFCSHKM